MEDPRAPLRKIADVTAAFSAIGVHLDDEFQIEFVMSSLSDPDANVHELASLFASTIDALSGKSEQTVRSLVAKLLNPSSTSKALEAPKPERPGPSAALLSTAAAGATAEAGGKQVAQPAQAQQRGVTGKGKHLQQQGGRNPAAAAASGAVPAAASAPLFGVQAMLRELVPRATKAQIDRALLLAGDNLDDAAASLMAQFADADADTDADADSKGKENATRSGGVVGASSGGTSGAAGCGGGSGSSGARGMTRTEQRRNKKLLFPTAGRGDAYEGAAKPGRAGEDLVDKQLAKLTKQTAKLTVGGGGSDSGGAGASSSSGSGAGAGAGSEDGADDAEGEASAATAASVDRDAEALRLIKKDLESKYMFTTEKRNVTHRPTVDYAFRAKHHARYLDNKVVNTRGERFTIIEDPAAKAYEEQMRAQAKASGPLRVIHTKRAGGKGVKYV